MAMMIVCSKALVIVAVKSWNPIETIPIANASTTDMTRPIAMMVRRFRANGELKILLRVQLFQEGNLENRDNARNTLLNS